MSDRDDKDASPWEAYKAYNADQKVFEGGIKPEAKFYGYLTGLSVTLPGEVAGKWYPGTRFAEFWYGDKVTIWEVPDADLFERLSGFLCAAGFAAEFDHIGPKLWIEYREGAWVIEEP